MSKTLDWIAVDWGTSNVRLWGMTKDNNVLFNATSDRGMGQISPADYPDTLLSLIGASAPENGQAIDVIVCGMAGAKQGWKEAPYLSVPATLSELGSNAVDPHMSHQQFRVKIISGISQSSAGVEDVMRGEETQLLGLLELRPNFSGIVCLPGTHSKWAKLDDGSVTEFTTVMTGELFEILRAHSVLRHSMPQSIDADISEDGLLAGLKAGIETPEQLTGILFKTRAASLLSARQPDWCAGYLSGVLIGAEVAGQKNWLDGRSVPLIGSSGLCHLYAKALDMLGVRAETIDATKATLAGLSAARK